MMSDGTEMLIAHVFITVSKAEINYSQIDKEALAIIWGVKKLHNYWYGQNFFIVTDHQPLTSLFHQKKSIPIMTAARLQWYAIILSAHNYSIEYRKPKLHRLSSKFDVIDVAASMTMHKFPTLKRKCIEIIIGIDQSSILKNMR